VRALVVAHGVVCETFRDGVDVERGQARLEEGSFF
jgi:hypothetical protein